MVKIIQTIVIETILDWVIKSQSESLKAFQWVPCFVLHYARYKIFIASIDIWFCYLKTVPVVLYLLSQKLSPLLRFFFSRGKLYWHIVKTRFPAIHSVFSIWKKSFPLKCSGVNNTLRNSSLIEKKAPRWISLNLYSNRAHSFLKHLVACLGRHGASANFLTLSRDRATLGTIFTTTTRNLSACDVIMKMVYWVQTDETRKADAISKSFVKLFSAAFLMRQELYHKSISNSRQWGNHLKFMA